MKFVRFDECDYPKLYDWMYPLWQDTYKGIVSKEHIDFMLKENFEEKAIERLRNNGYMYYKLVENEKMVGVVVFFITNEETHLDKLYLLPEARGKGYPALVFKNLLTYGKDVTLNVNRNNKRAFKCYTKNGFKIDKIMDIKLSNGMINQDYIMRLPCNN